MARRIPDELITQAAELVKNGTQLKEASAVIGCSVCQLSKRLKVMGVEAAWHINWESHAEEIFSLYEGGMGTPAIAAHFGIPNNGSAIRKMLTKYGRMRDKSCAQSKLASRKTFAEKKASAAIAKTQQIVRMRKAVLNNFPHNGIGFGEFEVCQILEEFGFNPVAQKVFGDFNAIDIAAGNIAVEVKTSATHAYISKDGRARFEKLSECGYSLVFVVVNHIPTLRRHADDLIRIIQRAQSNPPAPGEYWVVRCTLEQLGADTGVDHWSFERRFPNPQEG